MRSGDDIFRMLSRNSAVEVLECFREEKRAMSIRDLMVNGTGAYSSVYDCIKDFEKTGIIRQSSRCEGTFYALTSKGYTLAEAVHRVAVIWEAR